MLRLHRCPLLVLDEADQLLGDVYARHINTLMQVIPAHPYLCLVWIMDHVVSAAWSGVGRCECCAVTQTSLGQCGARGIPASPLFKCAWAGKGSLVAKLSPFRVRRGGWGGGLDAYPYWVGPSYTATHITDEPPSFQSLLFFRPCSTAASASAVAAAAAAARDQQLPPQHSSNPTSRINHITVKTASCSRHSVRLSSSAQHCGKAACLALPPGAPSHNS
mgnify:CR=1 FL=1